MCNWTCVICMGKNMAHEIRCRICSEERPLYAQERETDTVFARNSKGRPKSLPKLKVGQRVLFQGREVEVKDIHWDGEKYLYILNLEVPEDEI